MPRTKRPIKKQDKSTEDSERLKKIKCFAKNEKNKIDKHAQMECRDVELAFKILLGSFSGEFLQRTVGQLKNELYFGGATARSTHVSSHSGVDDGYLTENSQESEGKRVKKPTAPSTASRSTSKRSRSADVTSRRAPPTGSRTAMRRRSRSVYRTPAYNNSAGLNYPIITPKMTPQTPLIMLRQPRQGETVVSMSGSPVMVPTCYTMQPEEKANCNILLRDGTVLSLQPKQLRKSQAFIPFSLMDSNVLQQLQTLTDNMSKIVKLGKETLDK